MTADELEFEISGIAQTDPQIDYNIEGENLSVKLQNSDLGGAILVAEFDANNALIGFSSHLAKEEIKVQLLSATRTAKIMWWNSLEKMIPLADSKTVRRNSDF